MGGCMCGYGGSGCWCGGRRHFLLRWILGIIILGAVFSFGVKLGEFKAFFREGYGPAMMRGGYGGSRDYYMNSMMFPGYGTDLDSNYYGPGMMGKATTTHK